jgi:putative transposase
MVNLPRSTFYYQRNALQLPDKYAQAKQMIREVFTQHKGRYGYRRIASVIRQAGCLLNHKTVQKLMRLLQLKSYIRAKRYRSYKGDIGKVAANLLQREFAADTPNQKWVTDVTEFNVLGQRLYLSPILDLYNGEIVSYHMAKRPHFEMVGKMLAKAFVRLDKNEQPMLHSDQGWQYQMPIYQKLLSEQGLTQSMSRKGNCLDNAAMESFFGTLKSELFHLQKFKSVDQLQTEIDEYIHYYNHDRIKLKLKGLSPVQYRNQSLNTA